jgi:hypothetical protein
VLVHWNTAKRLDEIVHVYMRDALVLRPDLYPDNKIVMEHEHGQAHTQSGGDRMADATAVPEGEQGQSAS